MLLKTLLAALFVVLPYAAQAQNAPTAQYGTGAKIFSLATGSPGELGLLKALAEAHCAKADCRLDWFKAGSGEGIAMLKEGKVDMIMVHAPKAEKAAVAEGFADSRTLIGSNEFFIVGPKADPAGIRDAKSAAEAYAKIAAAKARFYTRADNSGTHKKEMDIWKKAVIEPTGDWYVQAKDFMTAVLKRADREGGYFMTDSSTWVAEKKNLTNLEILFRGDAVLVNTYYALRSTKPGKGPETAKSFIDFVASEAGQTIMRDFGKAQHGEGLYNDAAYAKRWAD